MDDQTGRRPEPAGGPAQPPEPGERDPWAPPEDRVPDAGRPSAPHLPTLPGVAPAPPYGALPPGAVPPPPPAPTGPGTPSAYPSWPAGGSPYGSPAAPVPAPYGPTAYGRPGYGTPGPGHPPGGYPAAPGVPYGPPGSPYGWQHAGQLPDNGQGVAALVLGIVGLVLFFSIFFGIILGTLAIIFGALGRGRANRGEADNGGQALAGLILGVVAVVASLIVLVAVIADEQDDEASGGRGYPGTTAAAPAPDGSPAASR